jgi:hypothetical protein
MGMQDSQKELNPQDRQGKATCSSNPLQGSERRTSRLLKNPPDRRVLRSRNVLAGVLWVWFGPSLGRVSFHLARRFRILTKL